MDSDFPRRMAGGSLGLEPLDLQAGLQGRGPLHQVMAQARVWPDALFRPAPMAPENSWPHYELSGSVQPEVSYGA
jgi:hypothetical protein